MSRVPPASDGGAALDPGRYATLRRMVLDESCRFVVSLGGGSVPGLCGNMALIGMLDELGLREHVDEVWGTSAGAAIGGAWATGTTAEELLAALAPLRRRGAVRIEWSRVAWALLLRPFGAQLPDGLIRGRALRRAVDSTLKVPTFEECPLPFRCVAATDDGDARRKVFRRGPLLPAIFASLSLPGIIEPEPPADESGHRYHDGGLVEKTPLLSIISDHKRRDDPRRLIVLATHFGNDARSVSSRGFVNRFLQGIYALEDLAWSYQLAEARGFDDVELLVLNPRISDAKLLDFGKVEASLALARERFAADLDDARIGFTIGGE